MYYDETYFISIIHPSNNILYIGGQQYKHILYGLAVCQQAIPKEMMWDPPLQLFKTILPLRFGSMNHFIPSIPQREPEDQWTACSSLVSLPFPVVSSSQSFSSPYRLPVLVVAS
jgi:hypothetical protein